MRASDFTNEEQLTEIPSSFVNKVVDKTQWGAPGTGHKTPPKGQTASVWQHMSDPTTVVKLVGGGAMKNLKDKHKQAAIAFVDFLVHHGKESQHLPIVHGINVDDPEVVQIKVEALKPFKGYRYEQLAGSLADLADVPTSPRYQDLVNEHLKGLGLHKKNSAAGIVKCVMLLNKYAKEYSDKYNLDKFVLDLHEGNWMVTNDGVIVAVDPWFAGW